MTHVVRGSCGGTRPGLVELRGFEPRTYSLRTRRATNCAIAPGGDDVTHEGRAGENRPA